MRIWKAICKRVADFYCWIGFHHPEEVINNRILTVTCRHCSELLFRGVI